MNKQQVNKIVFFFFLFLIFWMILASEIKLVQLILGSVASLFIVFYNRDIIFSSSEVTTLRLKTIVKVFALGYRLLIEIIKANISVVKIVLSPKLNVDPGFVKIRQPLKKDLNKTLYANAITLTPGTLTIDINDDEILVHGLKKEYATSIEGSKLESVFMDLERAEK